MRETMNTRSLTAMLLSISIGLCLPALAYGQIPNPGLDVTGGSIASWNLLGTASALEAPDGNGFAIFSEGGAGLARLTQSGIDLSNLTTGFEYIAFRYRMVSDGGTRDPKLPPDAFIVRVYLGAGGTAMDHVVSTPLSNAPMSYPSAYYRDTDPSVGVLFNSGVDNFSRTGPDADGYYVVRLDLSDIDRTSVTIEFDFAYSNNGEDTFVQLDGIFDACPPSSEYCCNSDLSVFTRLDDGDFCTTDTCDGTSGVALHTDVGDDCCAECRNALAKVVIMLDVTGSVHKGTGGGQTDELREEVEAAMDMLDAFSAAAVQPYVAIGKFSTFQSNAAIIVAPASGTNPGEEFTNQYGTRGPQSITTAGHTGLYLALADIYVAGTQGGTDIGAAIDEADTKLTQIPGGLTSVEDETLRDFIVIVSDGQTTHDIRNLCVLSGNPPENPYPAPNVADIGEECDGCDNGCDSCTEFGNISHLSWCSAELATISAENDSTNGNATIIGIYYDAGNSPCHRWCGETFMRDVVSSNTDSFIDAVDSSVSLECAFSQAVEIISCPAGTQCVNGNCQ